MTTAVIQLSMLNHQIMYTLIELLLEVMIKRRLLCYGFSFTVVLVFKERTKSQVVYYRHY